MQIHFLIENFSHRCSVTPLLTQRANARNHVQNLAVRNLLNLLAPPPLKVSIQDTRLLGREENTLQTTDTLPPTNIRLPLSSYYNISIYTPFQHRIIAF